MIKLRDVRQALERGDISTPQCPECGYHETRPMRKRRVDFYGCPVVWHCDCGWEQEISSLPEYD